MKKSFSLFLLSCFFMTAFSQQWVELWQNPHSNFYDIQKEFEAYWEKKKDVLDKMRLANRGEVVLTEQEKSQTAGWKQFKRWEWFMEPRVYPTGERFAPDAAWQELQKENQGTGASAIAGNWAFMGPSNVPSSGGAGRVNCVRFDPNAANVVYAGAPSGGLWKSTNSGNGWTMWNTDALGSLGVSDVAVDPTNSNIIYIGTGDKNGGDTYGVGVLKSTDGGLTWNTTGMNWQVTQGRTVRRILIDPSNTQIIHVAASNGIWKSTNGGTNFTQVFTTTTRDLELKPDDPTIIYACTGAVVYKSSNSGQSYSSVYAVSGAGRLELAVTPANADYLYVLAANNSNSGFLGLYRSTNAAVSFTQMSSAPNLLGWSNSGSDTGGQGWYDLAVAASPSNADEVITGGVNIWKSTDGGSTWTIIAHWTGSGAPYVHADIHDLIYFNGTTIFAGCDGGVFRSQNGGSNWGDLSNGLQIAQMYRLGQSANNSTLILQGWQDNGTNRLNGVTWTAVIGGDGMECFIDRTNNSFMFGELYNGDFRRSTNGGSSWSVIQTGLSGSAAWVTPWMQDPVSAATLWAGYSQMFRTINYGTSWTQMGTLSGSGTLEALDVAPSNNQVIYAARTNALYKSTDGGSTWTSITSGLPVASVQITYIEVDPADENHLYVTFSGYSSSSKVYVSTNGGSSWTNYSTGLPNLPVNCIVYEAGSNDGVYAGTDIGVYFRDASMSSWLNFSTGMPNAIVNELEIMYSAGKIRAATYGRGLWQSDLYISTGITENENCKEEQISIFPNPTSGEFQIQLAAGNWQLASSQKQEASIEIYNVYGEKVYSAIQQFNNSTIDITLPLSMGKGIYLVIISNGMIKWQGKVAVM